MIIYLCIKFESNTLIFSKDMERKPFFTVENFSKLKRAITPKIIGGFYPKSNLTTFYDYIPVYKISIQYTNLFKRYCTETICVIYGMDRMDGTDGLMGRTYIRTAVILYAPHPTPYIENGGGIKNLKQTL